MSELFTHNITGEQAFVPVVGEEFVEVVLLSTNNDGNHAVAYRHNGATADGEWQVGTIADAMELAEQMAFDLVEDAAIQAERDALMSEASALTEDGNV